MEVPIHDSLKGDLLNIFEVASFSTDHIIIIDKPQNLISEKLLNRSGIAKNKEKLTIIKYSEYEEPDFIDVSDQLDKVIKKISS